MADNFSANAGSGGDTFAADDVGGVKYLRNKMVWGADGAVNDVSAAAPMPAALTTLPTITKGTQGATGITTQDLVDAGRNVTNYFHALPIITTAAEVMQTLTGYKSGAAVAATAQPAVVTAGKTYRITSIMLTYIADGTIGSHLVTLRANTGGLCVIGSPLVMAWNVGTDVATAGAVHTYNVPIPDGLEFAAGTGIGIGVQGLTAAMAGGIRGYSHVAIHGFEY